MLRRLRMLRINKKVYNMEEVKINVLLIALWIKTDGGGVPLNVLRCAYELGVQAAEHTTICKGDFLVLTREAFVGSTNAEAIWQAATQLNDLMA